MGSRAVAVEEVADRYMARGDEFPRVKLEDWVQAVRDVVDGEGATAAAKGDLGIVVDKVPGSLPTVWWERTRMVCDAEHGYHFEVLCAGDFASDESTTPKKPHRAYVKRGVS
jgi:hypothetical protein